MTMSNIATLTETRYLRLAQIIGSKKAKPPIPAILPVSKSTFWNWVKSGRISRPIKLGPRISVWKTEEIFNLITTLPEAINSTGSEME